jgi:hypothetical protein
VCLGASAGTPSHACHAEGRGFESHHPLSRTRRTRQVFSALCPEHRPKHKPLGQLLSAWVLRTSAATVDTSPGALPVTRLTLRGGATLRGSAGLSRRRADGGTPPTWADLA